MGRGGVYQMKPYALLFAGQGAQTPGMGLSLLIESPELKPYFDQYQTVLSFSLTEVLTGEDGRLNQTLYTQPSLAVTSLLLFEQLRPVLSYPATGVAGFSLGEITALVASGLLSPLEMLTFLTTRATAMEEATQLHPGKMAAILGATDAQIHQLIAAVSDHGHVEIVNYNCPGQRVISGDINAIDQAVSLASSYGARRAIPLAVSGAFHSQHMASAKQPLAQALTSLTFHTPTIPQYFNKTGAIAAFQAIPGLITEQVASPVQFETTLLNMARAGIQTFIEIGPGSVLSGFVKKTLPEARVVSYNGLHDQPFIKELLA